MQFNVPFSVIIFTDMFVEKYTTFLENDGHYEEDAELRPFVLEYVTEWMKERGAGHYKFINEIMFILFSNSLTSISERKKPDVIEHIDKLKREREALMKKNIEDIEKVEAYKKIIMNSNLLQR